MSEVNGGIEEVVDEVVVDDSGNAVEEDYKPTLTYKVLDEEKEFDKRLHDVVKDKETEKYIRDLYTRADGLDSYKKKYGEVEQQASMLVKGFEKIKSYRDAKDFGNLTKALGINNDDLINHVKTILERERLPEDRRAEIERLERLEEKNKLYEERLASLNDEVENSKVENDLAELKGLVQAPTTATVAQAMKKHGFDIMDEVIKDGQYEYSKTGKEPPIKDVVTRIVNKYKHLSTAPTKKETLPTVKGGNSSAISKPISSLAELRKLADAHFA